MMNHPPSIFWSWQNDYSPKTCRHFIREALANAIAKVADENGVDDADRPEIDHDTKGERGMADIPATILAKIQHAAVFVADLTPIAQSPGGKWIPNPNVMIELGWAMYRPGWERVIGVLNTASGAEIEDLPFDIRQRRVITFDLEETADTTTRARVSKKLTSELAAALQVNLEEHTEILAAETAINGIESRLGDPSIWGSAVQTLTHNDGLGSAGRKTVTLANVPRSYLRVIPAGWKNGTPSVSDIARLKKPLTIEAPSDGCTYGDFGATDEGFVRYWVTGRSDGTEFPTSTNMVMFFSDTGEFWLLHGSVIAQNHGQSLLKDHIMLGQWSRTLRQVIAVMDSFGAHKTRRVEVGLFNVSELRWFSQWVSDRIPARRNFVRENRQSQDWGPEAQLAFLAGAYNRVKDLFALDRSSEAEVTQILQQFDPERYHEGD